MPLDEISAAGIVHGLEALSHGFKRLEAVVDKMADSVNRLAVMEERQLADRQAVDRAFAEIESIKKRVITAELQLSLQARSSVWVERAVWAAACGAVIAVASGKNII
jgi:hypothetical protein